MKRWWFLLILGVLLNAGCEKEPEIKSVLKPEMDELWSTNFMADADANRQEFQDKVDAAK